MGDLVTTLSTAITLGKRHRELGKKIENSEFKNLLADLNLELAEAKLNTADLLDEIAMLRGKVRELEAMDTDPCPKCRVRQWNLVSSSPDPVFEEVGGLRRIYKFGSCGYSESLLYTP